MEYWQDDKRIARFRVDPFVDPVAAVGEVYDWESGTWLLDEGVAVDVSSGRWVPIDEEKALRSTEDPQGWLGPSPT
ncbi:hypothetical protein [Nocardioides sp. LHG3406-4]|uniref:hypothetical protein n=1 Tax=Nocardioides sp. LHG3406-4 TaxID=2804575 RepID=UPI003CF83D8C